VVGNREGEDYGEILELASGGKRAGGLDGNEKTDRVTTERGKVTKRHFELRVCRSLCHEFATGGAGIKENRKHNHRGSDGKERLGNTGKGISILWWRSEAMRGNEIKGA